MQYHQTMESGVKKSMKILYVILIFLVLVLDQLLITALLPVLPCILQEQDSHNASSFSFPEFDNSNGSYHNVAQYLDKSNLTSVNASNQAISGTLGLLFGLKGITQIVAHPIAGALIDYTFPLLSVGIGLIAETISQLIFAFTDEFFGLCLSRCFQGIGAAAILTGSFAGISEYFKRTDDRRRTTALANIATFFGGSIGPLYGGFVYQYMGRLATFMFPFILSGMASILMLFLTPLCRSKYKDYTKTNHKLCTLKTSGDDESQRDKWTNEIDHVADIAITKPTPIYRLVVDPYIVLVTVGLIISNIPVIAWYPTLPLWMLETFNCSEWEQGLVWLPGVVFYLLGSVLHGIICHYLPRYIHIVTLISFLISAASAISIPFVSHWMICMVNIGIAFFSNSIIEITLMPMLATIVDRRYSTIYGSISSFPPIAFSLATMCGAFSAGILTEWIGFTYMNFIISSLSILYSPCLLLLRKFC